MTVAIASTAKPQRRAFTNDDYHRFLPMVRRIAMRMARRVPSHIAVGDLIGAGWVGLAECMSRASTDMPQDELEAYASYRIKGAMLDYIRSSVPKAREIRNASRRLSRVIATLQAELGRPPEEAEIAKGLGMSLEEYRQNLEHVSVAGMAQLERVDVDYETLEGHAPSPEGEALKSSLVSAVAEAIPSLPARTQQLLVLYYQEDCSLKEIGAIFGVTESRVCQLHSEAIHRLRAAIGGG